VTGTQNRCDTTAAATQAFDPDENTLLLGMLNHFRELLQAQREVTDRWFRYYLLIVGIPFIVIGAFSGKEFELIRALISLGFMMAISLFLFFVGLLFLLMNAHQRINSIRFYKRIIGIEKAVYEKLKRTESVKGMIKRYGADFYVGLVQIFVNSCWFFVFIYILGLSFGISSQGCVICALLLFFAVFSSQFMLRDQILWNDEKG